LRNSRNAARLTPPFCASTVISASDWITTPRKTLWQNMTSGATSSTAADASGDTVEECAET
jgi:hypothetical protein